MTDARTRSATLFVAVAALLLGTAGRATALQQRRRVYPIYATLDGRSYAQQSAEWWKWAIEAQVKADVDALDPSTLFATVDGYPIPNLASYRAHSPTFFVDLPPDNVLGAPPGVYGPAASDGYWLMLVPSRPGPRTVHFGGQFPDGGTVDVTYNLDLVL